MCHVVSFAANTFKDIQLNKVLNFCGSSVYVGELIRGFSFLFTISRYYLCGYRKVTPQRKKLLFNDTDLLKSWWVSHIKTIQSRLSYNNTFQSLCFMQGAISSAAPPHLHTDYLHLRVCVWVCVRGGKENNPALTEPLLVHYELEATSATNTRPGGICKESTV